MAIKLVSAETVHRRLIGGGSAWLADLLCVVLDVDHVHLQLMVSVVTLAYFSRKSWMYMSMCRSFSW